MNKSCLTCANWCSTSDEYTDAQARQAGFGRCDKAKMLDSIIEYDHEEDKYTLNKEHKDVKMCVMDGSSYRAELYTKPEFFCSEHASKEPT